MTVTPIKPRRVKFAWQDTPLHWIPEDPQTTHTINVLHLLLPAGEKWFVEVYREALPLVEDEDLPAQMKGFMGQEAVHARAHQAVLDHLAENGLDATPYTRRIDWLFAKMLAKEPFGRKLPKSLERRWLNRRLGMIAAIEHFTAILGDWVITSSGALDDAGADPVMVDLLRWHGAEEVEHRSVAFDVYEQLCGSHAVRVITMLPVTAILTGLWIAGTRFFMRNDPTRPGKARWRDLWRADRSGRLPSIMGIARSVPRYMRRDYHPAGEASTEDALAYLARSPAALAAAS